MGKKRNRRALQREKEIAEKVHEALIEKNELDFEDAADDALFVMDKAGSKAGKRIAEKLRREREEGRIARLSSGEAVRIERILSKAEAAPAAARKAAPKAPAYDIWGGAEAGAPSRRRRAGASAAKKAKKKATPPAVILPASGQSVNPSFTAHQDALGAAVAAEIEHIEEAEAAAAPFGGQGTMEGTVDPEMEGSDSESDYDSDDSTEEASVLPKTRKMRRGKLTRAQRNRQKEAKARRTAAEEERARRGKLRSVNAIGDMLRDMKKEARRQKEEREERQLLRDAAAEEFEDPSDARDVMLSDEIARSQGSLVGLTVKGAVVSERARTMELRGQLPKRKAVKRHRKQKLMKKVVTKVR